MALPSDEFRKQSMFSVQREQSRRQGDLFFYSEFVTWKSTGFAYFKWGAQLQHVFFLSLWVVSFWLGWGRDIGEGSWGLSLLSRWVWFQESQYARAPGDAWHPGTNFLSVPAQAGLTFLCLLFGFCLLFLKTKVCVQRQSFRDASRDVDGSLIFKWVFLGI